MIIILLQLLIYDYIPKDFEPLKRNAIKSSFIRPLSNFKPEPIITPTNPLKTDFFFGTVLKPIFGITVKELKGYAMSETKKHLAIIVDRNSETGLSILRNNSVFVGENETFVSLDQKFADDGNVAIFNISEIDPLTIFNNFDLTFSSVSGYCQKGFGDIIGSRCKKPLSYNWDTVKDVPDEIKIPKITDFFKGNVKLYGGIKGDMQASAIVKKRGIALQVEFDSEVDLIGGVGFHINAMNSSMLPLKDEYVPKYFDPKPLGTAVVHIFTATITLKALLTSQISIYDIQFNIPHDVDIMRMISIRLRKSFTVSTKHAKSPDLEKNIKVGKVHTKAVENGYNKEIDYLEGEFNATFSISAGIDLGLYVGKTEFHGEAGPEIGFELSLKSDKSKCTFPGFIGAVAPFIGTYFNFTGKIVVAGLKLWSKTKKIHNQIFKKEILNKCFFDGSSSTELDQKLLETIERKRSVIQITDPKLKNINESLIPGCNFIYFLGGNLDNDDKGSIIGFHSIEFDNLSSYKKYIIIPESKNYSVIIGYMMDNVISSSISKYPFEIMKVEGPSMIVSVLRNESQPIIMGNQIDISNSSEFMNFRTKFIPSRTFSQPIDLILHTKQNGYFCDSSKYNIIDEIDGEKNENIHHWAKISISKIVRSEKKNPLTIFIFGINTEKDDLEFIKAVQMYYVVNLGEPMKTNFTDFVVKISLGKNIQIDDKLFTFIILDGKDVLGHYSITYGDLLDSNTFIRKYKDIEITFLADQNVDDIEYVLTLDDDYRNKIQNDREIQLKGIVSRSFVKHDEKYKTIFYTNEPIYQSIEMDEGELYGNLKYYFDDPGYDIKTNKKVFAFIKIENSQPLLDSSKIVDEKDELYVINLEMGKSVFSYGESYILSIPFRRREFKKEIINTVLYCIFQSHENSTDSPYCPNFPSFKIKSAKNFNVGCIQTYLKSTEFSTNQWKLYSDQKDLTTYLKSNEYPNTAPSGDLPFSRLHSISYNMNKNYKKNLLSDISIVATQEFINFPDESRVLIIEEEIVQKMLQFDPKAILKIYCPRCGSIYLNSYPNGKKLIQENYDNYLLKLDNLNINGSLTFEAVCKNFNEKNCVFEYDISQDGVVLLEFNPERHLNELKTKYILEGSGPDLPSTYPGIEEIYRAEDDDLTKSKLRFNINCRRQIIPERKDKIYLTKPWDGPISKIGTHLEQGIITIKMIQEVKRNTMRIHMKGKGFNAKNPEVFDEQLIPFNPNFFTENDDRFKELLSEIGITIKKTKEQTINDGDVSVDEDGIIEVKKELFDEKTFKNNIKSNNIALIDIPSGHYTIEHQKWEDINKGGGSSSKSSNNDKSIIDQEVSPKALGNFNISVAYVGSSPIIKFPLGYKLMSKMRDIFGKIIPAPDFLHTAVWVGSNDARDETPGVIFVYGDYHSKNDPTYLFSDGARAFVMTLETFKKSYKYDIKKLYLQRDIKIFEFMDEIKLNGNWNANQYSWSIHNCQHFTSNCLRILQAQLLNPNVNDWKNIPKTISKTFKLNEKNHIDDKPNDF